METYLVEILAKLADIYLKIQQLSNLVLGTNNVEIISGYSSYAQIIYEVFQLHKSD